MDEPLETNVWKLRGNAILWAPECLTGWCSPAQVTTVRDFLRLYDAKWAGTEARLVGGRALIVAGLEACIDAIPPSEAQRWLEERFYQATIGFQREVAQGGTEAALVFWFAKENRFEYALAQDAYQWHVSREYGTATLPLPRLLWNGSAASRGVAVARPACSACRIRGRGSPCATRTGLCAGVLPWRGKAGRHRLIAAGDQSLAADRGKRGPR